MSYPLLRVRLLLFCFAAAPAAFSQNYVAKAVTFNNHGDFTQQQLEDAAGIHPGSSFKAEDLSAAAQRLVDTGYFDGVSATVEGAISSVTVMFDIKPTPHTGMLPVTFANFVWLTHEEIEAAIKTPFPMFIDYLPENSPRQDDIKAALTQALAAKSITAKVICETFEPTLRHPIREISYSVASPAIRVTNVKLGGVNTTLVPLVQKSINSTVRTSYTEGPAEQTTAERILASLLDAGYIQAGLANLTLAPPAAVDGSIGIVLSAKLDPGDIYHVSEITFPGTPIIAADTFTASSKLHTGDIASHAALLETLAPLDAAYRRQGYVDVVVSASPKINSSTHQVAYNITVVPGEQYRIHEVTPNNLDPAALADFNRGFLLKAGSIYNPEYVSGFLKANTALRALVGYSAAFKAYADPNTHTVDLVIDFVRTAH